MKKFKTEREWSDLERADKVALFVGIFIGMILAGTCFAQSNRYNQLKSNIVKTEMVNHR